MPFKQTKVPRYLILEGPPRKTGWLPKLIILLCIGLGTGLLYYSLAL